MFDLQNTFNGMFGKIESGKCRLSMNGEIAVKCSNGYKCYNVEKKRLTNVTNFCFNVGDEMFFVVPTSKVKVGDIILVKGTPKCVVGVSKESIKVIDYENSEIREVVPERHVFMGSAYFYGKIVSMFGNTFRKGKGGGLKKVIRMMMMSQMMGGGGNNNGGLGQMMAMSMFMNNGEDPFDGMFDFDSEEDITGIADAICDDEDIEEGKEE